LLIRDSPAKPSRPSRAYLKVKEQSFLDTLSTTVKETSFQDAKNTSKDSCLLGPPSLEFAPYNKTPSGRIRNDGRQGTIDQDQEFIDFLQSLTEPITKATANGVEAVEAKQERVSTTPLVQYIKEKKANKAKEASQAKAAKTREGKEAKTPKSETKSTVIIKGKSAAVAEKERVAKATQDAVRAIQKSVAAIQGKQTAAKAEAKQPTKETPPQSTPAKKERERGNASAAARMLQRDLGIVAKENKAQRTPKASAAAPAATTDAATSTKPTPTLSVKDLESVIEQKQPTPSTPSQAPPTGPRASRTPSTASNKASATPSQRPAKNAPQPSAGAKSAFLKHANPSQGITEDQLQTVFKEFGTIMRCEIDKKKGLGYIDFSEPDGLKKAMAASPVKVANGQVVVLENKSQHGKRGGGGSGQGNAGSGKAAPASSSSNVTTATLPAAPSALAGAPSPKVASATPVAAPSTSTTQTETLLTLITAVAGEKTAATGTPPTAPRGSSRGGSSGRGGRGNSGGRGNFRGSTQGSRPAYRGGRGNYGSGRRSGGGSGSGNAEGGAAPKEGGKEEGNKD